MKQILQNMRSGTTEIVDVPCPRPGRNEVLIRTVSSLISPGTERMLVDFGKAGIVGKAAQQPQRVRQVIDKMKTDGVVPTLEAVFQKLNQPLPLGYSNVGIVIGRGESVTEFAVGDRVVSNGHHAQVVNVGENLCARIPDGVSDEQALFTVLGSIALQGIRLADPQIGETVVVTGLGLIGLLSTQILLANGCRVIGLDYNPARVDLAKRFGAEGIVLDQETDAVSAVTALADPKVGGVDAVLLTASTKSSGPVKSAAQMCRKRGRIILVGVAGLTLSREDFYEKELTFQVSCSYGPGRYDPNYEIRGFDYPAGFVRWTEKRNFEAVLRLLGTGQLVTGDLVTQRYSFQDAESAYLALDDETTLGALGLILDYPNEDQQSLSSLKRDGIKISDIAVTNGSPLVDFIGAGNYASRVLAPAFKEAGAQLNTVVSQTGRSGTHLARRLGFQMSSTDNDKPFETEKTDAIVIASQHDSHAEYVIRALEAGKHVFVEKPLAMTLEECDHIEASMEMARKLLMVGFNRRFAPNTIRAKQLLSSLSEPKSINITVNAGQIAKNHWTQQTSTGGGRILGEACHFIDLARHFVDGKITQHHIIYLDNECRDNAVIQLGFADGSIATIQYFSNGPSSLPKERIEILCAGRGLQIENFRSLRGFGWKGFRRQRLFRQDKGQRACAAAFLAAIKDGTEPIPIDEIFEVSRSTIKLAGYPE